MSLPTCPSCGQSVLEDNAVDCPFCGAAMDGSRGAKNTPRPKANPVANRPGARKQTASPAASPVTSAGNADVGRAKESSSPSGIPSRPVATGRGSKPVVDEDDPFGLGASGAASNAVQATAKPEKGRLLKVVCPMCEQIGFVPKSAAGKQVRCANEKCMVPVFTATEGGEPARERKPARLTEEAESARNAADAARAGKRSPMMIYLVAGGVLLLLTLGLIPLLTKKPDTADLNTPVVLPDFGPTDEEIAAEKSALEAKQRAADDAVNPLSIATANVRRMITLARQPNLRDKAWARRMTGDLYLRLGDMKAAATEFSQLLNLERGRSYYRIAPHITRHWRAIRAGDRETARKELEDALADVSSLPTSGRLAMDAAMTLASALMNDGRVDQAWELIAARQLDTTIADNRDSMLFASWSFVATQCRDAGVPLPALTDIILWSNALHTSVAADLALHDRWGEAIAWSVRGADSRTVSDGLVVIADLAAARKAPAEVFQQIDAASAARDRASALRVQAAVAAALKDRAKAGQAGQTLTRLPSPGTVQLPVPQQVIQETPLIRTEFVDQGLAAAEVVRAALIAGDSATAESAMAQLLAALNAVAPSTVSVREPLNAIDADENGFRQQLGASLGVTDENRVTRMLRDYRRKLEQYARVTEDRRLLQQLLLCRLIRSGGGSLIGKQLVASPEFRQDVFLDELSGLLTIVALQTGQEFPEFLSPDVSLRRGRARFGNAATLVPIIAVAEVLWNDRNRPESNTFLAMETGAGVDLPGVRQILAAELLIDFSRRTSNPQQVLNSISRFRNGIWREEGYHIAGRILAERRFEREIDTWLGQSRIPPMEQVALLYGVSLGILERAESGDAGARRRL